MSQLEPILQENKNRFVIFPIKHSCIVTGKQIGRAHV